MDDQKQKLIERINQAQNILVTVSTNPSVDQLASAIGLSLSLNKLNKHATAVFSGQVPSTIEFLKPEDTLEKNTDSLRDFIIALDKSKADKLRYKVEDQVVRIFITPYRTSISEKDLNFSQGDFNVDVVIALGVTEQQDLDGAITAHGRILHDATVASVTNVGQGSLGTINWVDPSASSLSEMMAGLISGLDTKVMDNQIATALLTGIVASTDRFSNEKTTPKTMSASATLMAAGADPKLVATELAAQEPAPEPAAPADEGSASAADAAQPVGDAAPLADEGQGVQASSKPAEPGMLAIDHLQAEPPAAATDKPDAEEATAQIEVDEDGQLRVAGSKPAPQVSAVRGTTESALPADAAAAPVAPGADGGAKRSLIMEPPKLGDPEITASASPEAPEPSTEELTLPAVSSPLLSHGESVLKPLDAPVGSPASAPVLPPLPPTPEPSTPPPMPPAAPAASPFQPAPPSWRPPEPPAPEPAPSAPPAPFSLPPLPPTPASPPLPAPRDTLADLEKQVSSSHLQGGDVPSAAPASAAPAPDDGAGLDAARDAVLAAYNSSAAPQAPLGPIAGLNAQPLGPDLRPDQPVAGSPPLPQTSPASVSVPNLGFSEPTPGNTPADSALDMPLPSNPFGPGMQMSPRPQSPSAFPGTPPPMPEGPTPPPVPPPMFPPM